MGAIRASSVYDSVGGTPTLRRRLAAPLRRLALNSTATLKEVISFINRLQAEHEAALRVLRASPLEPGVLIRGIAFTAGQQQAIAHKLGKAYTGFICTYATGGAWDGKATPQTGGLDALTALMTNPNAGTFDLYFF